MRHAEGAATSILGMLSCLTIASISQPKPVWVYDSTPGVEERAYRIFCYPTFSVPDTRALDEAALAELLEEKFDQFLAEPNIKDDFKERVQRAVSSFRRGLADNDDSLSEFIVYWSSMEGLDRRLSERCFPRPSPNAWTASGTCSVGEARRERSTPSKTFGMTSLTVR